MTNTYCETLDYKRQPDFSAGHIMVWIVKSSDVGPHKVPHLLWTVRLTDGQAKAKAAV